MTLWGSTAAGAALALFAAPAAGEEAPSAEHSAAKKPKKKKKSAQPTSPARPPAVSTPAVPPPPLVDSSTGTPVTAPPPPAPEPAPAPSLAPTGPASSAAPEAGAPRVVAAGPEPASVTSTPPDLASPHAYFAQASVGPGLPFNSPSPAGGLVAGSSAVLRFSLGVALDVTPNRPNVDLQILLPLTIDEFGYSLSALGTSISMTVWGFELTPCARVLFPVGRAVRVFGDLGLGLAHYEVTVAQTFMGYFHAGATGLSIAIGGGGMYALGDHWRLIGKAGIDIAAIGSYQGIPANTSASTAMLELQVGAGYQF